MADAESKIQNPKPKFALTAVELVILALAAAVLLWSRAQNFSAPLDPDEANYGFIGSRLVSGDRMYVDVWDQQPPLTFLIFGWLRQVFGPAESTFRAFAAACSLLTLFALYLALRRSLGVWAGITTAVLWALASHDPGTDGDQANREIYMNTCAAAALWCLARVSEPDRPAAQPQTDVGAQREKPGRTSVPWLSIFLAGLLIAVGTVFKIILALLWFALLPWLLWVTWRAARGAGPPEPRVQRPTSRIIVAVALFGLGPLVVWGAHLLYFAADGRLQLFLDAVILHNLGYASGDVRDTGSTWAAFFTAEPWVFVPALPLWIAGLVGFAIGPWRPPVAVLIRIYAIATVLEIVLPGKFWRHYYYLLLPAATLLAGLAVARIQAHAFAPSRPVPTSRSSNGKWRAGLALMGVAVTAGFLTRGQYFWYYSRSAEERSFLRYVITALPPRQLGLTAKKHSAPGDAIYVHGDTVGVYYYADRRPATKYTMASQFLLAEYAGAAERQSEVAAALRDRPPRFIFLLAPPFDALIDLLEREYRCICDFRAYGPTLIFAHRAVAPSEVPPEAEWIWPLDPALQARCEALNAEYRVWHPPPPN